MVRVPRAALAAALSVASAVQNQESLAVLDGKVAAASQDGAELAANMRLARSIEVWQEEENLFVNLFRYVFVKGEPGGVQELGDHEGPELLESGVQAVGPHVRAESEVLATSGSGDAPETLHSGLDRAEVRRERRLARRAQESASLTQTQNGGRSAFDTEFESEAESSTSLGAEVTLDGMGYDMLTEEGRRSDMETFVRRVIREKGLRVTEEDTFQDILRHYNGECATQSYRQLLAELDRGMKPKPCHTVWLTRADNPFSPINKMRFYSDVKTSGTMGIGSSAPLNATGHARVAKTKDNGEMADYIKRVIKLMDMEVTNMWGLRQFLPYHSGECDTQTFVQLVDQLRHSCVASVNCGGGWVRKLQSP